MAKEYIPPVEVLLNSLEGRVHEDLPGARTLHIRRTKMPEHPKEPRDPLQMAPPTGARDGGEAVIHKKYEQFKPEYNPSNDTVTMPLRCYTLLKNDAAYLDYLVRYDVLRGEDFEIVARDWCDDSDKEVRESLIRGSND